MARLDARKPWAALLIPAFIFFFQKLYPFPWVNDPARRTAAAAAGCILVRPEAIIGFGSIRGALIDDCALAAQVKHGPPRRPVWLRLAGLALIYLAGPVALLALPLQGSPAAALGAAAWALSALAYAPTLRLYGLPAWQVLGLPLAALLYGAMTLDSALAHWRGRGGAWKGRTYPASG